MKLNAVTTIQLIVWSGRETSSLFNQLKKCRLSDQLINVDVDFSFLISLQTANHFHFCLSSFPANYILGIG
jgi:hypothetical protein